MIPIYDPNPPCKYGLCLTCEYADPTLVIVDGLLHRDTNINPEAAKALGLKLDDRGCIQFTE